MRREHHPYELPTALVAHTVSYSLALWVAFLNAPRALELSVSPARAIARGLVGDGLFAWWGRVGTRLSLGVYALLVLSSLFGSVARLAITRAGVYGVRPSAAYTHALSVLPRTLLARAILLVATAVLMAISLAPIGVMAMLWNQPHDARLHDLTMMGLGVLPLITLFVAHMVDDLVHVSIIVHGKRVLEALMLAVRALHRRAVYGAVGCGLFVLGIRVMVLRLALVVESGPLVTALAFSLLALAALVRAKLLIHYAAETQRFR